MKKTNIHFTMGVCLEKLGTDVLLNRIRIKVGLLDLLNQHGADMGTSDKELDLLHEASNKIMNIAAHSCGAVDVKYDGKNIEITPNPIADLKEII